MPTPGVYVEELSVRPPIEGAPTVVAFVGLSQAGPLDQPVEITSLSAFQQAFGTSSGDLAGALAHFFLNGGTSAAVVRASALPGSREDRTGLYALEGAGFSLLVLPGQTDPVLQTAALAFAQERRAFVILDLPAQVNTASAGEAWLAANPDLRKADAAAYVPWIIASDGGRSTAFPNSGAVAGVYARTDGNRGIWKAPAGLEADLRGVLALDGQINSAVAERLNPLGLNTLRVLQDGPVVWGGRTLAGADQFGSEWKYVNVRRLALFLERSIGQGLQWAVFEPNGEPLWAAVRLAVGTFINGLFRQGAFQGQAPREAYFVRCDATTTTADDIAAGRLIVEIGFAPLKPAEFVVIRISQMAGQDGDDD